MLPILILSMGFKIQSVINHNLPFCFQSYIFMGLKKNNLHGKININQSYIFSIFVILLIIKFR